MIRSVVNAFILPLVYLWEIICLTWYNYQYLRAVVRANRYAFVHNTRLVIPEETEPYMDGPTFTALKYVQERGDFANEAWLRSEASNAAVTYLKCAYDSQVCSSHLAQRWTTRYMPDKLTEYHLVYCQEHRKFSRLVKEREVDVNIGLTLLHSSARTKSVDTIARLVYWDWECTGEMNYLRRRYENKINPEEPPMIFPILRIAYQWSAAILALPTFLFIKVVRDHYRLKLALTIG